MHKETGCQNPVAKFWIDKPRAQMNVFNATYQADPQFSWKLFNHYITLALLSMAGVPF